MIKKNNKISIKLKKTFKLITEVKYTKFNQH